MELIFLFILIFFGSSIVSALFQAGGAGVKTVLKAVHLLIIIQINFNLKLKNFQKTRTQSMNHLEYSPKVIQL